MPKRQIYFHVVINGIIFILFGKHQKISPISNRIILNDFIIGTTVALITERRRESVN